MVGLFTTLPFVLFSVPIAVIDARTRRIPDVLTFGAMAVELAAVLIVEPSSALVRLMTAAMGHELFRSVHLLTAGRLGMGDAKYSALIGLALGPEAWFCAILFGSALGLLWAVLLHFAHRLHRDSRIPFAPFLGVASGVSLLLAPTLLRFLCGDAFP